MKSHFRRHPQGVTLQHCGGVRVFQQAAGTHYQLDVLAGLQEHFEESGQWFIKAVSGFARANDPHNAQARAQDFLLTYTRAPSDVRAKLEAMWEQAGLGGLPASEG